MARQTRGECNMSAEALYEAMGLEGYEFEGTRYKNSALVR